MNSRSNHFFTNAGPLADTIELMEFGDFACSQCRSIRQHIITVFDAFNDRLTYTFYHFPNHLSESSVLAALAAEAARRQGCFWPMFQALFTQPTINRTTLSILAVYLGMNHNQFLDDLDDEHLQLRIETDQQEGHRLGVIKTPTLFVGGQQFHGKLTQSSLSSIIRSQLSRNRQPILSKVDSESGTIYWGKSEWG
ncbi:DsbA family protein [Spirosoma spitsbergense]|uniref:DsbA family protein n=1 Tax=Spirosoma spitsbergense TaxID=431554 RepID=UPI00038115BC|nr:thioredoxin domain-containing protein [Spirosoma spitsbergense]